MKNIKSEFTNRFGNKNEGLLGWHRHPFAVPVITFMVLFFVTIATFVYLNGQTVGASDSKVVHLYVDGQNRVLPTRAKTVGEALSKAGVELREGDVTEPAADSQIIDQDFNVNVYRAIPVTVVDKGQRISTKVTESTPSDMAKEAGSKVYPEDKVEIAPPDQVLSDGVIGAKVVIDRATPANINLYGTSVQARTRATTVGELLKEKGIKTIEGDTVTPAPNTPISDNIQIFITSVGKQLATTEEVIPAPVEKIADPNANAGTSVVKEPGAPGKKIVTYEIELKNGKEVSRKAIQEVVASQPVKKVVAEGTKITISNPSANVALGEKLAAGRGWTGQEWLCLYQLWQKESKWNQLAGNRSGAYGIPQALPGSKMATAGSDWQTNPETQIKWGMNYIAGSKYRTPCGAWSHSRAYGWY